MLAVGVALMAWSMYLGWRVSRLFDKPDQCHNCAYSFEGIETITQCPECGTPVTHRRAGRFDKVSHANRYTGIGFVLIVLGIFLLGVFGRMLR